MQEAMPVMIITDITLKHKFKCIKFFGSSYKKSELAKLSLLAQETQSQISKLSVHIYGPRNWWEMESTACPLTAENNSKSFTQFYVLRKVLLSGKTGTKKTHLSTRWSHWVPGKLNTLCLSPYLVHSSGRQLRHADAWSGDTKLCLYNRNGTGSIYKTTF